MLISTFVNLSFYWFKKLYGLILKYLFMLFTITLLEQKID
jgi:hypothetical protein